MDSDTVAASPNSGMTTKATNETTTPLAPLSAPNSEATSRKNGITARAVLLGVVLAFLNAYWVTMAEVRFYAMDGSSLPLFITPVFILLVLVGINGLVARFGSPRLALKQEELLTAYIMAVISNTFAGHDMLQNLFGQITHPYYFAPQNNWQDVFIQRLPRGLFVSDEAALNAWYRGNTPPNQAVGYFVHWAVPLALWGGFFLVLVFLFWCVTALVRRAWAESERLAFPIIQLPLAMTAPEGGLFRSPVMWGGFAFAFLLGLINGLHELYPQVPRMEYVKLFDLGQYFTIQPLEAIRSYGMQGSLYPFAVGLAYFIPLGFGLFVLVFVSVRARLFRVRTRLRFGRAFGGAGMAVPQGDFVRCVDWRRGRDFMGEPQALSPRVRFGL